MPDDVSSILQQVAAVVSACDFQQGFSLLHPVLRFPSELDDSQLAQGLEALADISTGLGGDKLARALKPASEDPGDARKLYDAGFECIEEGLSGIAATLLARANVSHPNQPGILAELSSALEGEMLYAEAADFIESASPSVLDDPLCCYLLAFDSLMCGRIERFLEMTQRLRPNGDENIEFMKARLERVAGRIDALQPITRLDSRDLRGWHFALQGALLTHVASAGFEEGMTGRYAWLQDSYTLCRQGLQHLQEALAAIEFRPTRVVALGDRSSRILATAAAKLLNLPLHDWAEHPQGDELVVAYDLAQGPDDQVAALRAVQPGRLVFAHASVWTSVLPFVADITTLLYQSNVAPWDGGLRSGEGGGVEKTPPDESPEAELADKLLGTSFEPDNAVPFAQVTDLIRAGWGLSSFANGAQRERYFPGGPVPSSRFL
ncbi:MAG: hypothetical protein KDB68_03140 [Planctomycetes bacterium]|nr:hypothetical protein [Planctomycetota bacterium]